MKGKIKTLRRDKGYAFILGTDGLEYFMHRSALRNVKIDDVEEGDEVEFTEGEGPKGLRAENVYV